MSRLFNRAAVFTDIHFGLKSNSTLHNQDCLDFVHWATAEARRQDCDVALFLGDWHNNRASINVVTLDYSLKALEHLNENFDQVFFIPGNHDLYYRDRRDVQSVAWARHLPRIRICNDWFLDRDVAIAPWLVGDDHKRLQRLETQYVFGHFELPTFMMNAMVAMPEHGDVRAEDLRNAGHVFTGHFHKRQTKKNVTYTGNAFPHNYADAGDDDRGLMILEWGQEPRYIAWPEQPTYRVMTLSQAIDSADAVFRAKMHARLELDIDISYEEANFVKETFHDKYQLREVSLIAAKTVGVEQDLAPGDVRFESVDQIVTQQITDIESRHYDNRLLLEIWHSL